MNIDIVLFAIFCFSILILVLLNKKKLEIQKVFFPIYLVLYKTKIGLEFMDNIAKKFPKILKLLEYIIIPISYIGMVAMFFLLMRGMYGFAFKSEPSPVRLLFPGVETPGLPKLSFIHWIIAIFVLATVHEFSHGIFARLNNVRVKSSGFAVFSVFLPLFPAAFVEPDEKELEKKSKKAQLSVMGAGSFANFVTCMLFFGIFSMLVVPFTDNMIEYSGVMIVNAKDGFPANDAGINTGDKLLSLNNVKIKNIEQFVDSMDKVKVGEKILLQTDKDYYELSAAANPDNSDKGFLGVTVTHAKEDFKSDAIKRYGLSLIKIFFWFRVLIRWIILTNLFVGLFNLLPLGPVDGGRIFYITLLFIFRNDEKKSKKVWGTISIFLFLILIIALLPQFFEFITNSFSFIKSLI